MANWYQIHERGAGSIRMELLWWVYRIFGIRVLKCIVSIITLFITIGARGARTVSKHYKKILNAYEYAHGHNLSKFSSVSHINAFADSVIDKMSAICDNKTTIKFAINQDNDWKSLETLLSMGQGAFFICSHLGNIEVLCAIPNAADKCMHAFMNTGQNPVFRRFIARHSNYKNTIIHPTDNIDISTASDMYDALCRGELVMMAGDRKSPSAPDKVIKVKLLGRECFLPMGVFRFARACGHPVFAIANMKIYARKYCVFVRKISTITPEQMAQEYTDFLENLILKYPKQWFNFFDFWN